MTPKAQKRKKPYRRPDTYRALADLLGVSAPHVYQVLRGERVTTPARRRIIRDWAANHSRAGRSEAPAVAAALNLSSPKN